MLNKLVSFLRRYDMLRPGDAVVCAVSGGADSMALLWAMYLIKDKLQITLEAAHFNHHLRGDESDRDEAFVRDFCAGYNIPLHLGSSQVMAGKKGLEAAARDARYAFLRSLPGKIATAHTANDNAETVLMHMVRGTGLKGLGGIAPVREQLIRPMLSITRREVLSFLAEEHISYIEDSSNQSNAFLRNRLRHSVVPVLEQENPKLAENLSAMALRLREDEEALSTDAQWQDQTVTQLKQMSQSQRSRVLSSFLIQCGVKEPEAEHIRLAESLVFSENPSAKAQFPVGVTICRNYGRLEKETPMEALQAIAVACPGITELPELGLRVLCKQAAQQINKPDRFTVLPVGNIFVRSRMPGDTMRLPGGTRQLKKLFIDRKIPASRRMQTPVLCDEAGVLGVYGLGANLDRLGAAPNAFEITFETI